ncbi:MAG: ATPase P [Lachnospiraceae bacterium]|nr:ATPase P [Lachnospiraceae bacterium]
MIFRPILFGSDPLDPEILTADRKAAEKYGSCAIGERALYLGGPFMDCRYYVQYKEISRIFKRVAMSKGGFTGKGIFGSIPYLVVELENGTSRQCSFKREEDVDRFILAFSRIFPDVPVHSKVAERKLQEAREREAARYVKNLSDKARDTIGDLRSAQSFLHEQEEVPLRLSAAAGQKRIIDRISPTYRGVAIAIFLLAVAALVFGIVSLVGKKGYAVYFVLFGMAFVFFTISSRVLPTGKNNRRFAQKQWDEALSSSRERIAGYPSFPIPAQYAHPIVLERMIRVIREGRAEDVGEAYRLMKEDMKALNSSVTVSQEEYDEVRTVKPLFLVMDYKD